MRKFWLVCWNEYRNQVLRKRFIFAVLSMPLFLLVPVVLVIVMGRVEYNPRPVGYVDYSSILANAQPPKGKGNFFVASLRVQPFGDEKTARDALQQNQIQAYYVIEQDYLSSGRVRMVAIKPISNGIQSQFEDFMTANLLVGQPEPVARRLTEGTSFEVNSLDRSRELVSNDWLNIVLPLISGVLFIIVINTSGGYLLQAVVDEKENRTMEIIITSVSPGQLMAGKVVGNLSVGLTQLLVWLLFPLVAFLVLRTSIPALQNIHMQPQLAWLMVFSLLPAFVMVAAFMAAIGATATESREAQQVAGLFTLPIAAPYWFVVPVMDNPNSPLARGLSYFPLTAPLTLSLRAAFTTLPAWEIALSLGILFTFAGLALWLAGRAFRLGMLQYGKRISWKELFSRKAAA